MGLLKVRMWAAVATIGLASNTSVFADGPPATERAEVRETLHGVEVVDPYRWLEDKASPKTRAWLDEQAKYTDSMLGKRPERGAISKRLSELMKIDSIGVPTERGGRLFFSRRLANEDLASICMREPGSKEAVVLLDPHKMSTDHQSSVSVVDISRDGSTLAYGVRKGGEDEQEVHFMNVADRTDLADVMPRARYMGMHLMPDKKGFFYAIYTPEGARGKYHAFGTKPDADKTLFGEDLPKGRILALDVSEDGKQMLLLVFYGSSGSKTDVYYKDLAADSAIRPLVTGIEARFTPMFAGDKILLSTNWNAPRGRVILADLTETDAGKWKTIVPQSESILTSVAPVGGKLVCEYLDNASSRISLIGLDGVKVRDVELPVRGSANGFSGAWDKDDLYFSFTSFLRPNEVHKTSVATGTGEIWAKLNVPFNSADFEEKQVTFKSKDGTAIPMFLVHKKGLKLDGGNPVYLTGYGGFNLPRTPAFAATAAVWVENGGVFALPNLRGGGEFGEEWHKAGMLAKKQNVFDDFIGAAEWLIANGYTKPDKLSIAGGSNGGLLVGAAMTQRPDLYRAVVCSVPLLDMVRYHQFLVARFWVPEYGSSENAEQFKFIHAYSPYHRVQKGGKYPATMFVTGDSDTRVDPLHARKMCALVQWANASEHPILLHYDTKAGHSQGLPVNKQIADATDTLVFLFWQLGMKG